MSKIGLGIVTCNRPDFLSKCIKSIDLDRLDFKAIVNDIKLQVYIILIMALVHHLIVSKTLSLTCITDIYVINIQTLTLVKF